MKTTIECMTDNYYTSPELNIGETSFDFNNGEIDNVFDSLYDLYDSKADHDADGYPTDWQIMIPIYESTDCVGPSGPITIVGFAAATVHGVDTQTRIIDATVICGAIIPDGRSGAPGAGGGIAPLGTIPNLVS
jgi:hypothetical protein